jgi:hypothetical protein
MGRSERGTRNAEQTALLISLRVEARFERAPLNFFSVCDLTAEWLAANEHVRVHYGSRREQRNLGKPIPASRTNSIRRAPAAQQSLQNLARVGQHHGGVPTFHGVVADKQCTCPASKLMWERYPPTPPSFAWNPSLARIPDEGCPP